MSEKILVPDIGEYTDVEVISVAVKVGDTIAKEDELITLETDKATMEIPAPQAGTITAMLVKVGDKVSQGSPILELQAADGAAPAKEAPPSSSAASSGSTQLQDVCLPDLGSDGKVDVIEVCVKVGDSIAAEATLLTLESDKASMDIPAPQAGKVQQILVKVGDKVATGDKVAILEVSEDSAAANAKPTPPAAAPADRQPAASPPVGQAPKAAASPAPIPSANVYASPGVRRIAREFGVDLSQVAGSGRKNRILKEDVQGFVKRALASSGGAGGGLQVAQAPQVDFSAFGAVEEQPLSRIKKLSGSYLHRNWVTIPHVTQFDEADITEMEAFRKAQQSLAEKQGVKLTPLVFLMKACVAALRAFPSFNSSLNAAGDALFIKKYFHIGVAVDTPQGLVVPVVRDVDQKGLFQLAAELGEISVKARDGKLSAKEMQGGCFTISSLGGIGGTAFTPIVNAPEVGILGVSKAQMKQIYNKQSGEFEPKLMLPLSLSYDHRVIDGAEAVRFSTFLVQQLSDIRRLLL